MLWLLAIAANLTIETIFYLTHRQFARDNAGVARVAVMLMYACGALPIAVIWAMTTNSFSVDFSAQTLAYSVVASFLFSVSVLAGYFVDSKIEAAHSAIIHNIKPITVVLLGGLILGELLTPLQTIGAVIILTSATAVLWLGTRRRHRASRKNLPFYVLAIAAAVTAGAATVAEKSAINGMTVATYAVLGWGGQAAFLALYAGKSYKLIPQLIKSRKIYRVLFLGVLRGLASVSFVVAMKMTDNAPLVTVAAASKTALIAVGGYYFLHESANIRLKIAIAILTSIGVALLVF